jgi:hypothetical protein
MLWVEELPDLLNDLQLNKTLVYAAGYCYVKFVYSSLYEPIHSLFVVLRT